jgi:plasmid stability protein
VKPRASLSGSLPAGSGFDPGTLAAWERGETGDITSRAWWDFGRYLALVGGRAIPHANTPTGPLETPGQVLHNGGGLEASVATLNLKNFPDALYEHLRARARRERRSVAQEVIHLLAQAIEPAAPRSIMELQGLGKECWQGVDPVAYVRAERDSWDS